MTEPFADEHAPGVAASGAAEHSGDAPDERSRPAFEERSGVAPGEPSGADAEEPFPGDSEEEVVDGFPVLAEVRTIERVSPVSLPAVQAAAAAATGFVAGAATVALVKRRHARKLAGTGRGGPRRAVDMLPIVGSRSFLVDVHVIGKQGD